MKPTAIKLAAIFVIAFIGCNNNESDKIQISDGIYQSDLSAKFAPFPDTIRAIRYLRRQTLDFEKENVEVIDCVYKISQVDPKPVEDTIRDFTALKGKYRIVEDSILFMWDSLGRKSEIKPGKINFDTATFNFESAPSDHKSKIRISKDKVELVDKTTEKEGFNQYFRTGKKEF